MMTNSTNFIAAFLITDQFSEISNSELQLKIKIKIGDPQKNYK